MREIDFVIAWVDGNDPDWRKRKLECLGSDLTDDREERYRDWDLLRFWFRGVERFAPWVRKIWFVCDQEPPCWLNQSHPKLEIVRHEAFLPPEYRPTFSSHPIELNLHRILGLSEQFVYFNDDMFLLSPVKPDFFFQNGLPRDAALLNPIPTTDLRGRDQDARIFTIPLNNTEYLNRDYDFKSCVKRHPLKWLNFRYGKSLLRNLLLMIWPRFVGFDEPHLPQAFLKSSFYEAWQQDKDILSAVSQRLIRNDQDVNQWFIRERQLAEGKIYPRSPNCGIVFDLAMDANSAIQTVSRQKARMVCLNDGPLTQEEFCSIQKELQASFQQILPESSEFEKKDY